MLHDKMSYEVVQNRGKESGGGKSPVDRGPPEATGWRLSGEL
jgi:hypothetical protein